ncbi:hypothetical protein BB559_000242 [Furculomyces boomerangus]|uniref:Uncharacterized protein n=1 Tax=Furculomyces boomerangus TaxID=61424 RepID=A0A2T9Z5Z5_9FUNG|nr:hypothetical protein BB559_000242 [Furculomyces boomerangus]
MVQGSKIKTKSKASTKSKVRSSGPVKNKIGKFTIKPKKESLIKQAKLDRKLGASTTKSLEMSMAVKANAVGKLTVLKSLETEIKDLLNTRIKQLEISRDELQMKIKNWTTIINNKKSSLEFFNSDFINNIPVSHTQRKTTPELENEDIQSNLPNNDKVSTNTIANDNPSSSTTTVIDVDSTRDNSIETPNHNNQTIETITNRSPYLETADSHSNESHYKQSIAEYIIDSNNPTHDRLVAFSRLNDLINHGMEIRFDEQSAVDSISLSSKLKSDRSHKFALEELVTLRVFQRIGQLKSKNKWSFWQIKQHKAPLRQKTSWDHVLNEMKSVYIGIELKKKYKQMSNYILSDLAAKEVASRKKLFPEQRQTTHKSVNINCETKEGESIEEKPDSDSNFALNLDKNDNILENITFELSQRDSVNKTLDGTVPNNLGLQDPKLNSDTSFKPLQNDFDYEHSNLEYHFLKLDDSVLSQDALNVIKNSFFDSTFNEPYHDIIESGIQVPISKNIPIEPESDEYNELEGVSYCNQNLDGDIMLSLQNKNFIEDYDIPIPILERYQQVLSTIDLFTMEGSNLNKYNNKIEITGSARGSNRMFSTLNSQKLNIKLQQDRNTPMGQFQFWQKHDQMLVTLVAIYGDNTELLTNTFNTVFQLYGKRKASSQQLYSRYFQIAKNEVKFEGYGHLTNVLKTYDFSQRDSNISTWSQTFDKWQKSLNGSFNSKTKDLVFSEKMSIFPSTKFMPANVSDLASLLVAHAPKYNVIRQNAKKRSLDSLVSDPTSSAPAANKRKTGYSDITGSYSTNANSDKNSNSANIGQKGNMNKQNFNPGRVFGPLELSRFKAERDRHLQQLIFDQRQAAALAAYQQRAAAVDHLQRTLNSEESISNQPQIPPSIPTSIPRVQGNPIYMARNHPGSLSSMPHPAQVLNSSTVIPNYSLNKAEENKLNYTPQNSTDTNIDLAGKNETFSQPILNKNSDSLEANYTLTNVSTTEKVNSDSKNVVGNETVMGVPLSINKNVINTPSDADGAENTNSNSATQILTDRASETNSHLETRNSLNYPSNNVIMNGSEASDTPLTYNQVQNNQNLALNSTAPDSKLRSLPFTPKLQFMPISGLENSEIVSKAGMDGLQQSIPGNSVQQLTPQNNFLKNYQPQLQQKQNNPLLFQPKAQSQHQLLAHHLAGIGSNKPHLQSEPNLKEFDQNNVYSTSPLLPQGTSTRNIQNLGQEGRVSGSPIDGSFGMTRMQSGNNIAPMMTPTGLNNNSLLIQQAKQLHHQIQLSLQIVLLAQQQPGLPYLVKQQLAIQIIQLQKLSKTPISQMRAGSIPLLIQSLHQQQLHVQGLVVATAAANANSSNSGVFNKGLHNLQGMQQQGLNNVDSSNLSGIPSSVQSYLNSQGSKIQPFGNVPGVGNSQTPKNYFGFNPLYTGESIQDETKMNSLDLLSIQNNQTDKIENALVSDSVSNSKGGFGIQGTSTPKLEGDNYQTHNFGGNLDVNGNIKPEKAGLNINSGMSTPNQNHSQQLQNQNIGQNNPNNDFIQIQIANQANLFRNFSNLESNLAPTSEQSQNIGTDGNLSSKAKNFGSSVGGVDLTSKLALEAALNGSNSDNTDTTLKTGGKGLDSGNMELSANFNFPHNNDTFGLHSNQTSSLSHNASPRSTIVEAGSSGIVSSFQKLASPTTNDSTSTDSAIQSATNISQVGSAHNNSEKININATLGDFNAIQPHQGILQLGEQLTNDQLGNFIPKLTNTQIMSMTNSQKQAFLSNKKNPNPQFLQQQIRTQLISQQNSQIRPQTPQTLQQIQLAQGSQLQSPQSLSNQQIQQNQQAQLQRQQQLYHLQMQIQNSQLQGRLTPNQGGTTPTGSVSANTNQSQQQHALLQKQRLEWLFHQQQQQILQRQNTPNSNQAITPNMNASFQGNNLLSLNQNQQLLLLQQLGQSHNQQLDPSQILQSHMQYQGLSPRIQQRVIDPSKHIPPQQVSSILALQQGVPMSHLQPNSPSISKTNSLDVKSSSNSGNEHESSGTLNVQRIEPATQVNIAPSDSNPNPTSLLSPSQESGISTPKGSQ